MRALAHFRAVLRQPRSRTKIARSALRFGSSNTSTPASVSSAMRRWMWMFFSRQNVLEIGNRQEPDIGRVVPLDRGASRTPRGARPSSASMRRSLWKARFGKLTMLVRPTRSMSAMTPPRRAPPATSARARHNQTAGRQTACRPLFRSAWTTSRPRCTQVMISCSSSSTPTRRCVVALLEPRQQAAAARNRDPARWPQAESVPRSGHNQAVADEKCWSGFGGAILRPPGRRRRRAAQVAEERANQFAVPGEIIGQQESVVAAVALHVAVADRRVVGDQGVDDVAGLVGRKQPVAAEADDQPAAARPPKAGGQFGCGVPPRSNRSMAIESTM